MGKKTRPPKQERVAGGWWETCDLYVTGSYGLRASSDCAGVGTGDYGNPTSSRDYGGGGSGFGEYLDRPEVME